MWSNLILLHSDFEKRLPLDRDNLVGWQTCQRNIYLSDSRIFSESGLDLSASGYELYLGYQAYKFLLEVVSGLKSKLFGESEIQAQFRDRFRKENLGKTSFSESLTLLRDQILEHSKLIRSQFLVGIGRQTYGSIAELELKAEKEVLLLGTGKLAESILPYLVSKDRNIRLIGRNMNRMKDLKEKFQVKISHWEDYSPIGESVVIASSFLPFPWEMKLEYANKIIDFRERSFLKKPSSSYISFQDILGKIQETDENILQLKLQINHFIDHLTQEREDEQIHFLNGWEEVSCLK
ncbi:MAG: glutamyl-tRNA reductase [Leptospira sp.]|nr:glutamyl-tRNA reductase [Leptospira sp.]